MQCILSKIFFGRFFILAGKLICILYALLCWQKFILVKSGCYKKPRAKQRQPILDQQGFSLPHSHFIEHFSCMTHEAPKRIRDETAKQTQIAAWARNKIDLTPMIAEPRYSTRAARTHHRASKKTRTKSRRLATKLEAGNIGVETVSIILLTFRIQLRKRKELSM
jgi:hypothetical protein